MRSPSNRLRPPRTMMPLASSILVSWSCGASQPRAASATPVDNGAEPASPAASAAPAAIPSEPVETGKDCAKGTARCGGGTCAVTIENKCPGPVHCELAMSTTCDSRDGVVEASGRGRDTFAAGTTGDLGAQSTCTAGARVVRTEVKTLVCK